MAAFDDGSIVQEVLSGSAIRFSELVARYDRRVRIEIARHVDDPTSREDAVQEAFYKAFKNLGSLERPERFGAWLAEIARRVGVDHHRRRLHREPTRPLPESSEETLPSPGSTTHAWIWEEVGQLRPHFSEVLTLRYRQGRSYGEVAHRLGIDHSTVRGRIFEARRALRARLLARGIDW